MTNVQLVVRESRLARHHLPVGTNKVGIVKLLVTAKQNWTVGGKLGVVVQVMMVVAVESINAVCARRAVWSMQVLIGQLKVCKFG